MMAVLILEKWKSIPQIEDKYHYSQKDSTEFNNLCDSVGLRYRAIKAMGMNAMVLHWMQATIN